MAINIEHALRIPGWMAEDELTWLAEMAAERDRIVEVGSWRGRSTRALCDNARGRVWAVDTWHRSSPELLGELEGKDRNWLYANFLENMAGTKVLSVRDHSLSAAKMFRDHGESFGLIFLDAAHDYRSVRADIIAWKPLLDPGGCLAGHDFDEVHWPGVVQAVRELIPSHRVAVGTIWEAI